MLNNHSSYEPILDRNLREVYRNGKNIKTLNKIKVFDNDILAGKLQEAYRYEPNFAIESLNFNYDGWRGRSKYVQDLWQEQLRLYWNSDFAKKPATKSFYLPTVSDCHFANCDEYFAESTIDVILKSKLLWTSNPMRLTKSQIIRETQEDIIRAFLGHIYSAINQILSDSKKNGQLCVLSLPPIRYDKMCPSYFSITEAIIPEINANLSDYCSAHGIKFIDVFPLLSTKFLRLRDDLSDDGVYLNDEGYNVLIREICKQIQDEEFSNRHQTTSQQ